MRRFFGAGLGVLALGGCSMGTSIADLNPLASDDPPEVEAPVILTERVAQVESLEIGRGHRGHVVSATGLVPLQGYFAPELRLVDEGRPDAEGMIAFEFLARPPEAARLGAAEEATRRLLAAAFLPDELAAGATGVRILANSNSLARPF